MRLALAKAIVQKFKSDSNLQELLAGGLYWKQSPQNSDSPWGMFTIPVVDREDYMGDPENARLTATVDVHLYSNATDGGEELESVTELFQTAFNWQGLNVGSYSVDSVAPGPTVQIGVVDDVHENVISYEISMSKEL